MIPASDQELALRSLRGDIEAFGELVRLHQASVFNVCYRLAGERQEAEDLTQEAFMRAYQRLKMYDASRPFGPWMRRLAVNVCLNRLQSAQAGLAGRSQPLSLDDERDEPQTLAADLPEEMLLQAERARALRQALTSLPVHYRAVIELRHFQELSYTEIADTLKIPLSDVKSHLFRARQQLAKRLKTYA
jgi:RNA polymerase sigma-70 factor, ECF subfamily